MEVTRKNFKENLDQIETAIQKANFLAVDGEFTGLTVPGQGLHQFETPDERYTKLRQSASNYLMVQFGLAAFRYDPDKERYSSKVYNFYLFPRPFARQAPDVKFFCQSSSMDFLSNQGFDFNKVFKEGISYIRKPEEENLKAALYEKHATIDARNSANGSHNLKVGGSHPVFSSPAFTSPSGDQNLLYKGPCIVPDEHKDFIEAICTRVENFKNSSESELALDPCNGYLRKLTFQTLAQRFPSGLHLESKTNERNMRYILVSKAASAEEMRKKELAKRATEFEELDDAVGMAKVMRMISQSGKLVVGHNMILDVLHMIEHFFCSLPQDYEDFKHMTRSLLPRLLDTKLMATTPPFKEFLPSHSLEELHKSLQRHPFNKPDIDIAEDFPRYDISSESYHEAGYDAYITGICFISMANYLGKVNDQKGETVLPNSYLLDHYMNKLYLMRIHDIPFVNLSGQDISPCRDHVFHVVFPREWKASDISQLFSPFGNVQIAWVDDSSAFVALYRRDQADLVLSHIVQSEYYQISTYNDYHTKKTGRLFEFPRQSLPEKRKPSPVSDIDLPRKKRRSSSRDSFPGNRSITTIPEEEEAAASLEEGEISSDHSSHTDGTYNNKHSNNGDHGDGARNNKHKLDNDDCDEAPRKKARTSETETPLFAESDNWVD